LLTALVATPSKNILAYSDMYQHQHGIIRNAADIIKRHGMAELWRGVSVSTLHHISWALLFWVSYEQLLKSMDMKQF